MHATSSYLLLGHQPEKATTGLGERSALDDLVCQQDGGIADGAVAADVDARSGDVLLVRPGEYHTGVGFDVPYQGAYGPGWQALVLEKNSGVGFESNLL